MTVFWEGGRGRNISVYEGWKLKLVSTMPGEKIFVTGRAVGTGIMIQSEWVERYFSPPYPEFLVRTLAGTESHVMFCRGGEQWWLPLWHRHCSTSSVFVITCPDPILSCWPFFFSFGHVVFITQGNQMPTLRIITDKHFLFSSNLVIKILIRQL